MSTQNNVEAEITQGVQIPIQTVANNTVTVTFKDAALTLKVTPQITAADTVIMQIAARERDAGLQPRRSTAFRRSTRSAPITHGAGRATAQTTVIGGIYTSHEQTTNDRTPGLQPHSAARWLFKRDRVQRREPRAADLHHAAHHQELRQR